MRVLVNGIGNIGTTLVNLLLDFKGALGIDEVVALKNGEVRPWNLPELRTLAARGAELRFRKHREGLPGRGLEDIEAGIDYAFDCCAEGMGMANKAWYGSFPRLCGACAQGSELGFGPPFMTGLDDRLEAGGGYAQILSCNTHAIAAILKGLCADGLGDLVDADFVVARRSEDIGQHARLVGANVAARHRDPGTGTHHAADVARLLRLLGREIDIQSSDLTTPSQLMHAVRFDVGLGRLPDEAGLRERLRANPYISFTGKFDSDAIFELGRRYGAYGRIYSQAIVGAGNLLFDARRSRVKGWAFVPQEGNTMLSTLHAYLLATGHPDGAGVMQGLRAALLREEW